MMLNASCVWQGCDFSCVVETYDALHCDYGSCDHRCGCDDVVGFDVLG
jgi:hypothetical protein